MIAHIQTPNYASIELECREQTSDYSIAVGVLEEDEYRLRGQVFTGWALDIGAHIGSVGIALAKENPDLRVVCVEALEENCELIRSNVTLNGLDDRVRVIQAAAGGSQVVTFGYQHVDGEPDGYVQDGRYIGNMYKPGTTMVAEQREVPGVTLFQVLAETGGWISLLKLDCEGCEWSFLDDPIVVQCQTIVGEWHGDPGLEGLHALLDATHEVCQIGGNPTNGIFRALRR